MEHEEAGLALYDKLFEVGDEFNLKPGCPNLIERIESSHYPMATILILVIIL